MSIPEDKELGPVIVVETTAPIPVELLRRKYTENIQFVIDYSTSRFKGRTLINFLNNVGVPCRLKLEMNQETLDLVSAYLNHPAVVDIPDLNDIVMNVMLAMIGEDNFLALDQETLTKFVNDNEVILQTWFRRVGSLGLFPYYVKKTVEREFIEKFPVDEDASLPGLNFVQLIQHPLWPLLASRIPESTWSVNPVFFEEYIFAGSNLMYYFAHPDNPLVMAAITEEDDLTEVLSGALKEGGEE